MKQKRKTAATYSRFSSDMQRDVSITDQMALCQNYAAREGLEIIAEFSDRAKSGATLFDRDGLLELMQAAKARKFQVLICESLDRLSRDQADLAGLFKRLKFYGISLRTVNEGEATDIHVGLRGIVGAMYLKDLGDKVRRHHLGRAREGKVMGVVPYGYRRIQGRPGECEIDEEKAAIVRRIFTEYAAGVSPRAIAIGLTRDGIPSPAGAGEWSHQSFTGGGGRDGMLGNKLYVGEVVWNTHHTLRDPDTNQIRQRPNPKDEHVKAEVPELRILDQELWDRVQSLRHVRSIARFGIAGLSQLRPGLSRGDHLLSGLLRCGVCNGHMIINSMSRGRQFVRCAAAHVRSTCSHRKSYDIDNLKKVVVDNLYAKLADPQKHAEMMRAFHAEYAAEARKNNVDKIAAEKQRNRLQVQIARLVDAISDTDEPLPALMDALKKKEAERVGLEERIRMLGASNIVELHPKVIEVYTANIEKLHKRLMEGAEDIETRMAFRNVIDSIVVHETGYRKPYEITPYAKLAAMGGVNLSPQQRSEEKIIESEGVGLPRRRQADGVKCSAATLRCNSASAAPSRLFSAGRAP